MNGIYFVECKQIRKERALSFKVPISLQTYQVFILLYLSFKSEVFYFKLPRDFRLKKARTVSAVSLHVLKEIYLDVV